MNSRDDKSEPPDPIDAYSEFGEAFDLEEDPLIQFEPIFEEINVDPINRYFISVIDAQDIVPKSKRDKKSVIEKYRSVLNNADRHPACPNIQHVKAFIENEIKRDNSARWIFTQLRWIGGMFTYWQQHERMPHDPNNPNHNPLAQAQVVFRNKIYRETKGNDAPDKPHHRISVCELRNTLAGVENILYRSCLVTQLKYGVRSGQIENMQIQDVRIQDDDLMNLYPDLGSNNMIPLKNEEDVIYFPSRHRRQGTKSVLPAVMPIDEETKILLKNYLLRRDYSEEPWFFINESTGGRLRNHAINNIWKSAFYPRYEEDENHRGVTSHFARHRFNTWWKTEVGIENIEHLKYMRGSKRDNFDPLNDDVIQTYVHTYYDDIKHLYLSKIYKFNL